MHYTLLPESEHAAIHREYRTRAAIVFCFLMTAVVVIGMVALFPAYVFSVTSEKVEQQSVASLDTKSDKSVSSMRAELSQDAVLLSEISQYAGSPSFSDIVSGLVGVRGPVTYSSLVLDRTTTSSVDIIIEGTAPTRSSLLDLRSRLQNLKKGNAVDLPISELTKSVSVHFSLKVTEEIP